MSHSSPTSGAANEQQQYSLAVITFWLAFGTFMIGCSEFAAMGLLPYFAEDFGISEKVAGHAISAYALGVVVGAPLITLFFSRLARRTMLIAMMIFYAGGNLLTALAWSEWTMNAARFIAGLPHGAYFGIAMLFAADIAGKKKRAQAVSNVIMGLAIANIIGVPAISGIGQIFGWRTGFFMIAAGALVTSLMVWKTAPYQGANPDAKPMTELQALKNKDVLLVLLMGAIGFGGMFSVYSYFSASYLNTTGAPEWGISATLLIYGIGVTLGNIIAGRYSEGRLLSSAIAFQVLLGLSAAAYAASMGNPVLMAISLFFIGIGGGMVVPLQTRLMDVAGNAQTLAGAMNHASFNTANALGPWLAGMALSAGYGYAATGWVGVALAGGGVLVWLLIVMSQSARSPQPVSESAR
ncbi:MFS transporter [Salinimonas sediminis]|uniref:MFS transporter n=1 Tax=Salinimonas sediminis TaxID=2303538 RepID=A0A346NLF5_9ALTE|nr:MFS transporter [Salinimonas sediminis]AXR06362.1 MFS transporter [Salinimonas sediminis]